MWAGWLCRELAVDERSKGEAGERCHPHGCHCSFGSDHIGSYVEKTKNKVLNLFFLDDNEGVICIDRLIDGGSASGRPGGF